MDSGRLIKCNLVVAFFAACLCACTGEQEVQLDVESFSVHVIDKDSGGPLEGALVLAIYPSGSGGHAHVSHLVRVEEAITNSDGNVTFASWSEMSNGLIMEGSPRVAVAKFGYRTNVRSTLSKVSNIGGKFSVSNIVPGDGGIFSLIKCPAGEREHKCHWVSAGALLTAIGPVSMKQKAGIKKYSDLVEKYESYFIQ